MTIASQHSFTDDLILEAGDSWKAYINHPFIVQLRNGSLPITAFLHFIRQGYLFLLHYARIYALAAYKSKNFEDLAGNNVVIQSVLREIQANIEICAKNGISKADLKSTKESPTCIAYSRYILDIASTGDALDLKVATTACLIGYGEVGLRLLARHNKSEDEAMLQVNTNTDYYKWISTYAQTEYQEAVKTGRDDIEKIVAGCTISQAKMEQLRRIFRQTTEMEIAFWDDALAAVNIG